MTVRSGLYRRRGEPVVGVGTGWGRGGVVPLLMAALDARESEHRARVAELRERIAGLSDGLSQVESELSRPQITREMVKAVLACGVRFGRCGRGAADRGGVTVMSPDWPADHRAVRHVRVGVAVRGRARGIVAGDGGLPRDRIYVRSPVRQQ